MARKRHSGYDDDNENINYGSGEFTDKLLDNIDDDDNDDFDDDNNIDLDEIDEVASPLDMLDDSDEAKEVKANKTRKTNLKSKLIGKHSLNYDTIFKGKKDTGIVEDEHFTEHIIKNAGGSLDIDDSDIGSEESSNNIDSYRDSQLKKNIYTILQDNTDIKFSAHMRKPARTDFNAYFALLIKDLAQYGYTNSEIFIELSGYFSPNIWNMFQLLDKSFSNLIIAELKEKNTVKGINKIDFHY